MRLSVEVHGNLTKKYGRGMKAGGKSMSCQKISGQDIVPSV